MMRKNGGSGKVGSVRRVGNFSTSPEDYKLLQEVGFGASATVFRAIYLPTDEIVAVKCLDLDRCNSNLDDIRREAQTMSLIDHPNVIRAYCSFVVNHNLWVVMPYMAEGSCLHLMKISYPDGFEEPVIGSVLKETLKALEYLHKQGHIHRDVKAGNILLDSSGAVKLGDFGVSACMFDKGDRQRARNTFVGTPCWMAPEVLQPGGGYDFKADIWSFGITALELAHGHAPFSKYPPMKVLLMTLQNAPPGLDYERDRRFSKSFKEMIAMCLVKDQTKRPTPEKLLKHSFFKNAKAPELSVKPIVADLPPLWDRVKQLQLKDAAQLALKKMPSAEQEALSQSEYQRGVSAWNFDVEDLKAQASLIQDDEDIFEMKEDEETVRAFVTNASTSKSSPGKSTVVEETNSRENMSAEEPQQISLISDEKIANDLVNSSYQEMVDGYESHRFRNDLAPSTSQSNVKRNQSKAEGGKRQQAFSGPLMTSSTQSNTLAERGRLSERIEGENEQGVSKRDTRKVPNFSGPLMLPNRASANSLSAPIRSSSGGYGDSEDKAKPNLVQIKGRFSVTSENVHLVKDVPLTMSRRSSQGSHLRKSASVGDSLVQSIPMPVIQHTNNRDVGYFPVPVSIVMPHIQNLFHQTSFQQDLIMNLLNSLQQNELVDAYRNVSLPSTRMENDVSVGTSSEREQLLLAKISKLQARMISLTEELTVTKIKHMQLQQELNALYCLEEGECKDEENEDI